MRIAEERVAGPTPKALHHVLSTYPRRRTQGLPPTMGQEDRTVSLVPQRRRLTIPALLRPRELVVFPLACASAPRPAAFEGTSDVTTRLAEGFTMRRSLRHALIVFCLAAACDTSSMGPGTKGPPFFKALIDSQIWEPEVVLAYCSEAALGLSAHRAALPPGFAEGILIKLDRPTRLGSYVLGDSSTGRSGSFVRSALPAGPTVWYTTAADHRGRADITGLDLQDSVLAGTFAFEAVAATDPADIRHINGSFRAKLTPAYTVDHPDGSPCSVPAN